MPKRATALTAAAGEHYVAYVLSAKGYPVALTRGGAPTVDLMVGNISGKKTISIQVKTSNWAYRSYKRKKENNHWEWDVGEKAKGIRGDNIIYTFVDLRWSEDNIIEKPDVFIVPSKAVANSLGENWSRYMFWILDKDKNKYLNAWDRIVEKLQG